MTRFDLRDRMPADCEPASDVTARSGDAMAKGSATAMTSGTAAGSAAGRYATAAARWSALCARERAADGSFVYAVRTTGVFCRPSCAARQPLRANVEFFAEPAQARRAGYRACKRCAPEADGGGDGVSAIVQACRLLERETGTPTAQLASAVGLSGSYFVRAFKRHVGVTPQAYRRRVLAERAKNELGDARSVTDAVFDSGYASVSRFYAGAGRELGMTPRQARQGGPGQQVRYVVRRCSLGQVLVAWTERGVCEVGFGDRASELVTALRERFAGAALARADVPDWIDRVIAVVEQPVSGTAAALDVPLDIRGTAFQQRVWEALRHIPVGQTRSYTELARSLGAPNAARAVARACASNRLAVVVPCHRVLRGDGSLSGYRWRPERKRELLRREAQQR
jgi:AraC family transcriptional regulator of adaptative response/methylated-DNA-[protein]-cysteine methyltransferase